MIKKKSIKQLFFDYFFIGIMLLFYLSEGISKYYDYYFNHRISLPKNIKILVLIILIFVLVLRKKWVIIIPTLILILFFFTGQYYLKTEYLSYSNIILISKYIFPIFLLEISYLFFSKNNIKLFFKTFEYLIIFNFIFILIGLLFKTYLFNTYNGSRFGYNGLLITSATSTYFYIIAIYYLFLIRKKTTYFISLSIITIISSIIVGTKSIYLFLMLLILYYSIFNINRKYKTKAILIATILILFLIGFFFILEPSYIDFIKKKGLLTSILSYRDDLLIEQTIPFIKENWTTVNYYLGGLYNTVNRSQLGFIDLYITLGFIGSIIYLITFYKSLFKIKLNKNALFFLVSIIIIIALGGNFFFSATIATYLVIIQQIIINHNTLITNE